MAIIQGLEWTFNTVAEEYDKWSPEYVPGYFTRDLFAYQPLTSDSEVHKWDRHRPGHNADIENRLPPDCGGAGRSAGSADAEEIQ